MLQSRCGHVEHSQRLAAVAPACYSHAQACPGQQRTGGIGES